MPFRRTFSPVLDGGLVNIGDGTARKQAVRIESGEYTPPLWLRTESGLVIPVTELPWQGVVEAGQMEVLSDAPGGGGSQPALAFASDWGTATGSTNTALTDGSKWDDFLCPMYADILTVIAKTSGWPSALTNVMRVGAAGTDCGMVKSGIGASVDWAAPSIGQTVYFRIYFKNNAPNGFDLANQHWLQPNSDAGPQPWEWRFQTPYSGGVGLLQFHYTNQDSGGTPGTTFEVPITVGTVYRMEWALTRTGTLTATASLRLYEGDSTTLLYGDADFADAYASGPTHASVAPTIALGDVSQLNVVEIGNNGPAGAADTATNYFEFGAFAVSAEGWIGPYVSGEA